MVISHDPVLNPDLTRGPDGQWLTAPGPAIRTLTLDELKRYDIGRVNPASKYAQQFPEQKPADGQRFPTLAEFFAQAAPEVRFNIEIKTDPAKPDLTARSRRLRQAGAVEGIRKAKAEAAQHLQSFDWRGLIAAEEARARDRHRLPHHREQQLRYGAARQWPALALAGRARPRVPGRLGARAGQGGRLCDSGRPSGATSRQRTSKEAQALGLKVIPWTVNVPAEMATPDRPGCRRADHRLSEPRGARFSAQRGSKPANLLTSRAPVFCIQKCAPSCPSPIFQNEFTIPSWRRSARAS